MSNFVEKAHEFKVRLKAAKLEAGTKIRLVYHATDMHGTPLEPIRDNPMPTMNVNDMSGTGAGAAFALRLAFDGLPSSVEAMVLAAGSGPIPVPGRLGQFMNVHDVELEID